METSLSAARTALMIADVLSNVVRKDDLVLKANPSWKVHYASAGIKHLKQCFDFLTTWYEKGAYWHWKTGEVKVGVPVELTEAQVEELNNNEAFKACLSMYYKDKEVPLPETATWKWSKDSFVVTFKDAPSA